MDSCFKKAHMSTYGNTFCSPVLIVCIISAVKKRDVWKCAHLEEQINMSSLSHDNV